MALVAGLQTRMNQDGTSTRSIPLLLSLKFRPRAATMEGMLKPSNFHALTIEMSGQMSRMMLMVARFSLHLNAVEIQSFRTRFILVQNAKHSELLLTQ